jgi:hypothetical protein
MTPVFGGLNADLPLDTTLRWYVADEMEKLWRGLAIGDSERLAGLVAEGGPAQPVGVDSRFQ